MFPIRRNFGKIYPIISAKKVKTFVCSCLFRGLKDIIFHKKMIYTFTVSTFSKILSYRFPQKSEDLFFVRSCLFWGVNNKLISGKRSFLLAGIQKFLISGFCADFSNQTEYPVGVTCVHFRNSWLKNPGFMSEKYFMNNAQVCSVTSRFP